MPGTYSIARDKIRADRQVFFTFNGIIPTNFDERTCVFSDAQRIIDQLSAELDARDIERVLSAALILILDGEVGDANAAERLRKVGGAASKDTAPDTLEFLAV